MRILWLPWVTKVSTVLTQFTNIYEHLLHEYLRTRHNAILKRINGCAQRPPSGDQVSKTADLSIATVSVDECPEDG